MQIYFLPNLVQANHISVTFNAKQKH